MRPCCRSHPSSPCSSMRSPAASSYHIGRKSCISTAEPITSSTLRSPNCTPSLSSSPTAPPSPSASPKSSCCWSSKSWRRWAVWSSSCRARRRSSSRTFRRTRWPTTCTDGRKTTTWLGMWRPYSLSRRESTQAPRTVSGYFSIEFYKQPKEILLRVIEILEKQNKAAKIEIGNDISVKFLWLWLYHIMYTTVYITLY